MIRRPAGQVAVPVVPPGEIDLQFIYRAALGISWNPAEALIVDGSRSVDSPESLAAQIAWALREEYGMALRPSAPVQWQDFDAEERNQVASALFRQAR